MRKNSTADCVRYDRVYGPYYQLTDCHLIRDAAGYYRNDLRMNTKRIGG